MGQPVSLLGDDPLDLAELLNVVLDKGAVLHGDVIIAVADIDLIRLNVGLLIQAVASAEQRRPASQSRSLAGVFGPLSMDRPSHAPFGPSPVQSGGAGDKADERDITRAALPEVPSATASEAAVDGTPNTSLNAVAQGLPERINADADGVESGLARLVLTLIEVLRKVLEHQAVRRMEGGRLTAEEVERLGLALSRLDDRMQDLKRVFGLSNEDLQIDLGPLGRLR